MNASATQPLPDRSVDCQTLVVLATVAVTLMVTFFESALSEFPLAAALVAQPYLLLRAAAEAMGITLIGGTPAGGMLTVLATFLSIFIYYLILIVPFFSDRRWMRVAALGGHLGLGLWIYLGQLYL